MVAEIIRALPRDLTMVLIEHDMDLALGLVDYVTCMFNGRVLVEGTPDGIRRNEQVQEVYLGKPFALMLEVRDLHSFYGEAHVLHGVSSMSAPARSSRCSAATAWARPPSSAPSWGCDARRCAGLDPVRGRELAGLRPHDIARRKIAHRAAGPPAVRVADRDRASDHAEAPRAKDGWTVDAVFGIFPRLAERRHHRGGQLSGGERQMLAVARALMIDPKLHPDGRAVRRAWRP